MKRASLTKRERATMHADQGGLCACGCDRPLGERYIAEHLWAVAMGNESKPDALFRADCAAAKTRLDLHLIAKTKRQRGEHGQQARRARRKAEGKAPLIQGRGFAQKAGGQRVSRGFDTTLKKKMNGQVVKNVPKLRRSRGRPHAEAST
jgi:hypothetical protein